MKLSSNAAGLVAMAIIGAIAVFVIPAIAETFLMFDLTLFIVMSILALSLAIVWGYGGILCFGQSMFLIYIPPRVY